MHSAVQYLGRPQGGGGMYLEAIQAVIGDDGTILVPTFNFAFANGEPYDPQVTPSQGMGAFSECVRRHPEARRTSHPLQSLAVTGRYAEDLAGRDTPSAFDAGSAFDRMLELDFKLLLLGATINAASMFHYSEQRFRVPYRYWKDFSGLIRTSQGWQEKTCRMYVRDLELDPRLTEGPVQKLLEQRSQWRSVTLNYGKISACKIRDYSKAVDDLLSADPWSLVTNRPTG